MSSSSNSARLRIRQASQDKSVEMSARMPATLRTARLNRQTLRYFRDFQQAQPVSESEGLHLPVKTAEEAYFARRIELSLRRPR
jgi:hypothetical protein